jgi:hypothetical protein
MDDIGLSWISTAQRRPSHRQKIVGLASLVFNSESIVLGYFMRSRKGLPGRIQVTGGKHYSYVSLDCIHYWIPVERLCHVSFPILKDMNG